MSTKGIVLSESDSSELEAVDSDGVTVWVNRRRLQAAEEAAHPEPMITPVAPVDPCVCASFLDLLSAGAAVVTDEPPEKVVLKPLALPDSSVVQHEGAPHPWRYCPCCKYEMDPSAGPVWESKPKWPEPLTCCEPMQEAARAERVIFPVSRSSIAMITSPHGHVPIVFCPWCSELIYLINEMRTQTF